MQKEGEEAKRLAIAGRFRGEVEMLRMEARKIRMLLPSITARRRSCTDGNVLYLCVQDAGQQPHVSVEDLSFKSCLILKSNFESPHVAGGYHIDKCIPDTLKALLSHLPSHVHSATE